MPSNVPHPGVPPAGSATLLIANRGEIAVRIARTAREMGIRTVAVYSDADAGALHVAICDHAVRIGPAEPASSYLCVAALLDAARTTGATLLHPGYGFLSENADFADAVEGAGLLWVGPTGVSMRTLGSKLAARAAALALGIPVLPSAQQGEPFDGLGFPLLIKASAGGGGRGMRRVDRAGDLDEAIAAARAEALAAFGDDTVYAERLVEAPCHVEVQVFGDGIGGVAVLGDRDCSIQRRHQKLVEEAPCSRLGVLRPAVLERARALAQSVRYRSAATVEFLWDGAEAWFLEVNTRLQVEHPVTELVCGIDLVRWQLELALGGESLASGQWGDREARGHAIECRVVAEDPANGFLPAPGQLGRVRWPRGPGVRVDAGVRESGGETVSPHYDALLAKIIVHAEDRESARRRMIAALEATVVTGIPTTVERLLDVMQDEAFVHGVHTTATLGAVQPGGGVGGDALGGDALFLAAAALAGGEVHRGGSDGASSVDAGGDASGDVERASPGPWQTLSRWA